MKKFLKISLFVILGLFIFLILIGSCNNSKDKNEKNSISTPIESVSIPEETEEVNNYNLSVDECISAIEMAINLNFDNNIYHYTISKEDNVIMINQWWDDVELGISTCSNAQWNDVVNSLKVANNSYQQIFIENNHPEIVVVNNIVSDTNIDYILLSIVGGETMYDIKNGIDLYGLNDINN